MPDNEKSPEFERYIKQIEKRLKKNKLLEDKNIKILNNEDLLKAINELNQIADKEIKNSSVGIFTVTAISQSDRLDGLVVLILLIKMIYRIAVIYNLRQKISELIQLYANVFTTSFIVYSVEEIDINEQLEPLTNNITEISVIKTLQSVPFSALIGNMIFDGTI